MEYQSELISMDDANKKLLELYGRTIHDKPYYRIAKAAQKETLKDGSGFMHVVEKYNYIHPEAYLLEALMDTSNHPEIVAPYSYECLWAFTDENGAPLPLFWKPIEFILRCLEDGKAKTIDDYVAEDKRKSDAFKDWFMGMAENLAARDRKSQTTGETVAFDSTKRFRKRRK